MRPIDAEMLKEKLSEAIKDAPLYIQVTVDQYIDEAPTLTPPEIVCCQDCVHHEDGYAHWCNKWEHTCPDDSEFFCKFGRKKNDSTTD